MELLNWIKDYYVGAEVAEPEEIRRKIEKKEKPGEEYLLTIAANPSNVLDLIPAESLKYSVLYDACPMIVGIAKDKAEAMELAMQILVECQKKTGTFDVKQYLMNR